MNAILSSFAFCVDNKNDKLRSCYYRMPPISFQLDKPEFAPDYSVLFLYDHFFIDEASYDKLNTSQDFAKHLEMISALQDADRLTVVNFGNLIAPYADILDAAVEQDMKTLGSWYESFKEVVDLWYGLRDIVAGQRSATVPGRSFEGRIEDVDIDSFLSRIEEGMVDGLDRRVVDNLKNWKGNLKPHYREFTRNVTEIYFRHVNANILLSHILNAKIHDWNDIGPLYRRKFDVHLDLQAQKSFSKEDACRKVLEISLFQFEPANRRELIKVINDPRIKHFRAFLDDVVTNKRPLDKDFVIETQRTVIANQRKANKIVNITGWATFPLSFLPGVGSFLDKGVNEIVRWRADKVASKNHEWLFMLTDISSYWK